MKSLVRRLARQNPAVELKSRNFPAPLKAMIESGEHELPKKQVLARAVVGCAAFREVDATTCEMKRVYVRPAARGEQLGRRLVQHLLQDARAAGYARMCLDVLPEFKAAQQLYLSLGFTPAPPATFNPVPGTLFLGRAL